MKRPYGRGDYKELILQKFYYVDKTKQIEKIENQSFGGLYIFFAFTPFWQEHGYLNLQHIQGVKTLLPLLSQKKISSSN